MHQRNPDITAASITKMKPQNSNAVSFATVEQKIKKAKEKKENS